MSRITLKSNPVGPHQPSTDPTLDKQNSEKQKGQELPMAESDSAVTNSIRETAASSQCLHENMKTRQNFIPKDPSISLNNNLSYHDKEQYKRTEHPRSSSSVLAQTQKQRLGSTEGYQSDDEKSDNSSSSSSDEVNEEIKQSNCLNTRNNRELLVSDSFYSSRNGTDRSEKQSLSLDATLRKSEHKVALNLPPPNPLLPKSIDQDEPVRTGFSQKFVDVKNSRKFESSRAPQGLVKNQKLMRPNENPLQINTQSGVDDENNTAQETSLRHFFYLEYRRPSQPGERNPIVYNKFGKQHYDSVEKFCPETFSSLIRTCDLKQLLSGQPGDTNGKTLCSQGQLDSKKEYQQSRETDNTNYKKTFNQRAPPSRAYYVPKAPSDNTLVFESRFESGNLQLVHKVSDTEYNVILQNDVNSKGHTQWFYFRMQNTKKNLKVKFNFLNFIKPKSLYNDGMKVLIHSQKKEQKEDIGWFRGGEELSYYQNNYRREHMTSYQRCYYSFTFSYRFEYDNDSVFFSYSQPYSYSDLLEDISQIQKKKYDFITRNTLCRTLAGNKCEYLTITSRKNSNPNSTTQKKGVFLSGRVHPGESNSSWMMKGIIDYLVGDSIDAQILRNNFVFKIIPMLNPDGVISGNYRCSLAGCDLNRRWKHPSPILHPTIYHTKKLVKEFSGERPLILYCDLHGHSRRKNVFMYGNHIPSNPEATRLFPFLLSKVAKPHFSYDYSRFKVQRSKESTARIAMWKELRIPNIFTMEASFCGPKAVPNTDTENMQEELNYHFTAQDLMDVGKNLCQTLLLYCNQEIDQCSQLDEVKSYHQRKISSTSVAAVTLLPLEASIPGSSSKFPNQQLASTKSSQPRPDNVSVPKSQHLPLDLLSEAFNKDEIMSEISKKMKEERVRVATDEQENESSSGSDSACSEDNFNQAEMKKLMPKRVTKKRAGLPKRKKTSNQGIIAQKRQMKEEQVEKKEQAVDTKKKAPTQRGIYDFKKPTQSYLSKYSLIGKKRIALMALRMREAGTQTSDNEDSDYELSAMEKDIIKLTGASPYHPKKRNRMQPLDSTSNVLTEKTIQSFPVEGQDFDKDSKVKAKEKLKENVQVLFQRKGQMKQNQNASAHNGIYNSFSKARNPDRRDSDNFGIEQQKSRHVMSFDEASQPDISYQVPLKQQQQNLKIDPKDVQHSQKPCYPNIPDSEKAYVNLRQVHTAKLAKPPTFQHFSSVVTGSADYSGTGLKSNNLASKSLTKTFDNTPTPSREANQATFRRRPSQLIYQSPQTKQPDQYNRQHSQNGSSDSRGSIGLPQMSNSNSSSLYTQKQQLAPIVLNTHNRLQQCLRLNDVGQTVLEKIEEKIGTRSQGTNQQNFRRINKSAAHYRACESQGNYQPKNYSAQNRNEAYSNRSKQHSLPQQYELAVITKKQKLQLRESSLKKGNLGAIESAITGCTITKFK